MKKQKKYLYRNNKYNLGGDINDFLGTKKGGFFHDAIDLGSDAAMISMKNQLSTVGAGNMIGDDQFNNKSMAKIAGVTGKVYGAAAPVVANVVAPGSGQAVSAMQQGIGSNIEDPELIKQQREQQALQSNQLASRNSLQRRQSNDYQPNMFGNGGTVSGTEGNFTSIVPIKDPYSGKSFYTAQGSTKNIQSGKVFPIGKGYNKEIIYGTYEDPKTSGLDYMQTSFSPNKEGGSYTPTFQSDELRDLYMGKNPYTNRSGLSDQSITEDYTGKFAPPKTRYYADTEMAMGGVLPVNGNSHADGGIATNNGVPVSMTGDEPTEEVEGGEKLLLMNKGILDNYEKIGNKLKNIAKYEDGGKLYNKDGLDVGSRYVLSSKNGVDKMFDKVRSKYKLRVDENNRPLDNVTKKGWDYEMAKLMHKNDYLKQSQEEKQYQYGGILNKMAKGGGINKGTGLFDPEEFDYTPASAFQVDSRGNDIYQPMSNIPSRGVMQSSSYLKPMTGKSVTSVSQNNKPSYDPIINGGVQSQDSELYSGDNPWYGYAAKGAADMIGGAMTLSALNKAKKNTMNPSLYRPDQISLEAGRNAARDEYSQAISSAAQQAKGLTQGQAASVGAATRANLSKARANTLAQSMDKEALANYEQKRMADMSNVDAVNKAKEHNLQQSSAIEMAKAKQIADMLNIPVEEYAAYMKGNQSQQNYADYIQSTTGYVPVKNKKTGKRSLARQDDPKYSYLFK